MSSSSDPDRTPPRNLKRSTEVSSSQAVTSSSQAPKNKKKRLPQKYRPEWEKDPLFKKWIMPDTDSTKAMCRVCNSVITADKNVLKLHSNSKKHEASMKQVSGGKTLRGFIQTSEQLQQSVTIDKSRRMELKLAMFFAEHNISFNTAEHLGKVLKDCVPESEVIQKMTINKKKVTNILTKVIGPDIKLALANTLRNSKFSILTDESTDIGCEKNTCIMVRYFNKESGHIESRFWELRSIFKGDTEAANEGATAQRLYNEIKKSFQEHGIPEANILGFGSDGCNTMMGSHNSVASRFRTDCPGIIIVKCICHSAHLCASEACKSLPNRCEELARSIYNFFKGSSKRSAQLVQFQTFLNLAPHKMLHPSQTRWLSLVAVVNRILEQWSALTLFFTDMAVSERIVTGQFILDWLCDPFLKLYFYFLQWILPKFTSFNTYFQATKVVVTELNEKVEELYKEILLCYMKHDYVLKTPLANIDPTNQSQFLLSQQLYLGVAVLNHLNNEDIQKNPTAITDFRNRCRSFLIVAASEIKKRWDFNNRVMIEIKSLNPKLALSINYRQEKPSIVPLALVLPRIIDHSTATNNGSVMQSLDDQWRNLPLRSLPDDISHEKEADVFWFKLLQFKNLCGENEFSSLAQFALDALCIPHANADCERIFSKINLIKTKSRNRLLTNTINNVVLASDSAKRLEKGCISFEPTKQMANKIVSNVLYATNTLQSNPSTSTQNYEIEEDDLEFSIPF